MYSVRGIVAHVFMRLCGVFPLEDKVVFSSFNGKSYSDNPRIIFEEMRKRHKNLKYIWLMKNPDAVVEGAQVVKESSFHAVFHLATARLWIDNSRKMEWMIKRKGQHYVQTWHGDVCIKKIEKDAEDYLDDAYIRCAKHDSQMADLMISGSKFRTDNYRNAFWYDGEILESGTPVSDCFYKDGSGIRKKVREFFSLDSKDKIALYVPTFRDTCSQKYYDMDYDRVLKTLGRRWPGTWKIILKLHPNIYQSQNHQMQNHHPYRDGILNGSEYEMTNELIIASDFIITDYSGCMFHGLEAGKKVILYASDTDEYLSERGTYFNIRNMPFPLAEDNDSLEQKILCFDEAAYEDSAGLLYNNLGYFNGRESAGKIVSYLSRWL